MKVNIMKSDIVSHSGYVYPKEVMQNAIDKFNDKYNEVNKCLCDNEAKLHINEAKVSHSIYNMDMDDDGVITAELDILETPQGKILQTLLDSGVELKAQSSGLALIDVVDDVNTVVDYEYKGVQLTAIQDIPKDVVGLVEQSLGVI